MDPSFDTCLFAVLKELAKLEPKFAPMATDTDACTGLDIAQLLSISVAVSYQSIKSSSYISIISAKDQPVILARIIIALLISPRTLETPSTPLKVVYNQTHQVLL